MAVYWLMTGFDGKLSLDWEIQHSDPSHYSLSENPGTLTITTQDGGLWGTYTDYRNLFLIDCPKAAGDDFQVTTCISFRPVANWNQAGLVFYNDDDDYLKFVYEWEYASGGRIFTVMAEGEGGGLTRKCQAREEFDRVWLRATKRGNRYVFSTSLDGETFVAKRFELDSRGVPEGVLVWGDGPVKRLGILAKNGARAVATEINASFDFFKVTVVPGKAAPVGMLPVPWPTLAPIKTMSLATRSDEEAAELKAKSDLSAETQDEGNLLAYDGFDGKLSLDWKIQHPDPSHYSLSEDPGTLTIVTQEGAFSTSYRDYRNLFLIDCPKAAGDDFQVTTCISFRPVADWNQAGLVFYNDDDNYLKFVYEWSYNWRQFTVIAETGGSCAVGRFLSYQEPGKIWLRATKRGNRYVVSTSLDGETFLVRRVPTTHSPGDGFTDELIWGEPSVKCVGILAKNGPGSQAPEVAASFDFFEVRAASAKAGRGEEGLPALVP